MPIWDLSPPLSSATAPFPGDPPYRQRWAARIGPDSPVNVAEIALSVHLGAHADAPLHYRADGEPVGRLALAPFLGPCRVAHCLGSGLIGVATLRAALAAAGAGQPLPPRVLVRSRERTPADWTPTFAAFAPEAIDWLAAQGVVLVGIDTPSVDPADSAELPSHHRLAALDLRVLENLCLDAVAPGDYELIALPLPLLEADASPVRAVLRRPD